MGLVALCSSKTGAGRHVDLLAIAPLLFTTLISGVARGGAGGANAPPQIFVVPLLPKTPIGNRQGDMSTMHIITE